MEGEADALYKLKVRSGEDTDGVLTLVDLSAIKITLVKGSNLKETIPTGTKICDSTSKDLYATPLKTGNNGAENKTFVFTCPKDNDADALGSILLEDMLEVTKAAAAAGYGPKDPSDSVDSNTTGSNGLSAGAVAGIAIAVAVVGFLIGGVVVYFVAKPSE